jgi:hypothetical protein
MRDFFRPVRARKFSDRVWKFSDIGVERCFWRDIPTAE